MHEWLTLWFGASRALWPTQQSHHMIQHRHLIVQGRKSSSILQSEIAKDSISWWKTVKLEQGWNYFCGWFYWNFGETFTGSIGFQKTHGRETGLFILNRAPQTPRRVENIFFQWMTGDLSIVSRILEYFSRISFQRVMRWLIAWRFIDNHRITFWEARWGHSLSSKRTRWHPNRAHKGKIISKASCDWRNSVYGKS